MWPSIHTLAVAAQGILTDEAGLQFGACISCSSTYSNMHRRFARPARSKAQLVKGFQIEDFRDFS
jgi:hypothetical protein